MRTSRMFLVVLALCLVASAAQAMNISGTITDIAGRPVEGVKVWGGNGAVAYSDAAGFYSIDGGAGPGTTNLYMYKDNYEVPVRLQEDGVTSDIVRNYRMSPLAAGRVVYDEFNGSGGLSGRLTEDAGAYRWVKGTAVTGTVADGLLQLGAGGGNDGTFGISTNYDGDAFKSGNFVYEMRVLPNQGSTATKFMMNFRGTDATSAYYVGREYMAFGWGEVNHGNAVYFNRGWGTSTGVTVNANVAHTYKLEVNGYQEKIYVDNLKIWEGWRHDANETVYTGYPWSGTNPDYMNCPIQDGFFSISSFGDPLNIDYVRITELVATPEPGSIVALLSGLVGVVGFARRRRA